MGGFGFGFLFEIIFWGLVIWLMFSLMHHQDGMGCRGISSARGGHTDESALDILKKRYAKGELSKEDFDRMRKDLEA